jgi:nitrogen fixation protein FixH
VRVRCDMDIVAWTILIGALLFFAVWIAVMMIEAWKMMTKKDKIMLMSLLASMPFITWAIVRVTT